MHKLLAQRLQNYVKTSGLTYDALVEKTNIPRSTLYRYLKDPPETPNPDIVESIAVATGHTKKEIYDGIDTLPTDTGEYVAEIITEENQQLKDELVFERNLQQDLADKLGNALDVFNAESRKNDQMIEDYRKQIEKTNKLFDECRKTLYQERKWRGAKTVLICFLLVLAVIFGMYTFYAFVVFDLQDPTKGIWPPWWLRP